MGCTLGVGGYLVFLGEGVQNVFHILTQVFAFVINSNSKLFLIFFKGSTHPWVRP